MLLACCHIPGCQETAGRKGWICHAHWALVPKPLQLRRLAAFRRLARAADDGQRQLALMDASTDCIRAVLVRLWHGAFPNPEPCSGLETMDCGCPICAQARKSAWSAYLNRRYVETTMRAAPTHGTGTFILPRTVASHEEPVPGI